MNYFLRSVILRHVYLRMHPLQINFTLHKYYFCNSISPRSSYFPPTYTNISFHLFQMVLFVGRCDLCLHIALQIIFLLFPQQLSFRLMLVTVIPPSSKSVLRSSCHDGWLSKHILIVLHGVIHFINFQSHSEAKSHLLHGKTRVELGLSPSD